MKSWLLILSSLTTLTLTSNSLLNTFNLNNTNINTSLKKAKENENQTLIFNNIYGLLSISDWITNQSITNHKFYSYNTSALTSYTFTNARQTFLVDISGDLVYNSKIIIPEKDKLNIENTKQEMITNRKVTAIKDGTNLYSKSQYSTSYFSGDNQNWQYLQLGGIEKTIDVSKQSGADKVENNNNLSENLGLYYIGKAEKNNFIDEKIADNLGRYFMNQTSIKDTINKDLISSIIKLNATNTNVYNFIYNAPMKVTDKNYSINYIFDNSNNLVEIYYNKWNNNNIENNANYSWGESANVGGSLPNHESSQYTLLSNWNDYANSWNEFINLYPTFNYDKTSMINIASFDGWDSWNNAEWLGTDNVINTNNITTNNKNAVIHLVWDEIYLYYTTVDVSMYIWHDDHNIMYQFAFKFTFDGYDSSFNISLNNILFNSGT